MTRFSIVSLLGVVVFAVTLWLGVISPETIAHPMAGDTRDPIIAFEMVRTPAQLTQVIGEDRASYADLRAALDKVNEIDFVYMTLYGVFIAVFFMAVAQQRDERRWLILSLVGIVAMLADVRENMALLVLTQDGADVASNIAVLVTATWIKWFALGLASAGAGLALYQDQSMPTFRLIGAIVGVAAAGITVAAYVDPVKYPQYMALGIFVSWIMMVVYAYRVGRDAQSTGVAG
jgi:hypothetical protein